jgi:hypothetical protein
MSNLTLLKGNDTRMMTVMTHLSFERIRQGSACAHLFHGAPCQRLPLALVAKAVGVLRSQAKDAMARGAYENALGERSSDQSNTHISIAIHKHCSVDLTPYSETARHL